MVENLDKLSIDQLYEKVIAENRALLEQTLNVLEQIANKIKQAPDQVALLLLAQPLRMQFDVRKRQYDALQESWGLWKALGFLGKKLQANEERAWLVKQFADTKMWRKTLSQAEEKLSS